MFKQTALITWRADVPQAERTALLDRAEALSGAEFAFRGAGLTPPSWRGGDVVWHLHYASQAAWAVSGAQEALDAVEADASVQTVDAAAYLVTRRGVRDSMLTNGIYRTLLVAVEPHATQLHRLEFAEDTARMPEHIPEIVNWALNEVIAARGAKRWTHVWEQEYGRLEDLTGPYLQSPYHLFHVDRWFDAEMPCNIIAVDGIRHSASSLPASVIAHY